MNDEALCVCGHSVSDHHRSWFPGGGILIEECEAYGFNESGGMMYIDGEWVDHCQRFQTKDG